MVKCDFSNDKQLPPVTFRYCNNIEQLEVPIMSRRNIGIFIPKIEVKVK